MGWVYANKPHPVFLRSDPSCWLGRSGIPRSGLVHWSGHRLAPTRFAAASASCAFCPLGTASSRLTIGPAMLNVLAAPNRVPARPPLSRARAPREKQKSHEGPSPKNGHCASTACPVCSPYVIETPYRFATLARQPKPVRKAVFGERKANASPGIWAIQSRKPRQNRVFQRAPIAFWDGVQQTVTFRKERTGVVS
jgi:hypothetical protein